MERVGILGSGLMGSTIALSFALGRVETLVVDVDLKAIARGNRLIESSLDVLREEGVLKEPVEEVINRISFGLDLDSLRDRTFVIEAVPEVPDLKKKVFEDLDFLLEREAIIASNTSGINIFRLLPERRREYGVIAHFFAPAHIIPLVGVVKGPDISEETVNRTLRLLQGIGKIPLVLPGYAPGFLVNRIQRAIGETVLQIIEEEYASPEEIDKAIKFTLGIRLPIIGVVQTFDFQGLDMLYDAMRFYGKVFRFIEEKVKQGHLGVKTSKGIYDYGGRSEEEISRERDRKFLRLFEFLKSIKAFQPL